MQYNNYDKQYNNYDFIGLVCISPFILFHFRRSNRVEAITTSSRSCLTHPYVFCSTCEKYTVKGFRKPTSDFIKGSHVGYFKVDARDQHNQQLIILYTKHVHIICFSR